MSHQEANRIRRKLVPFMTLLLAVACIGLLASCGGGGTFRMNEKYVITSTDKDPELIVYNGLKEGVVTESASYSVSGDVINVADNKSILIISVNGQKVLSRYIVENKFNAPIELREGINTVNINIVTDGKEIKNNTYYINRVNVSAVGEINFFPEDSYVLDKSTETHKFSLILKDRSNVSSVNLYRYPDNAVISGMPLDNNGVYSASHSVTGDLSKDNPCFYAIVSMNDGSKISSNISCLQQSINATPEEMLAYKNLISLLNKTLDKANFDTAEENANWTIGQVLNGGNFDNFIKFIKHDKQGTIFFETKSGIKGNVGQGLAGTLSQAQILSLTDHYTSPFQSSFPQVDFPLAIDETIFEFINPKINGNSLKEFATIESAGIINIFTHGKNINGKTYLDSGVAKIEGNEYDRLISTGQIIISRRNTYSVGVDFLEQNNRSLKLGNSLVFISACQSAENDDLRNFFFGKGAKAFVGYNNIVTAEYANKFATAFYTSFMKSKSVQQSFIEAKNLVGEKDIKSIVGNIVFFGNGAAYPSVYYSSSDVLDVTFALSKPSATISIITPKPTAGTETIFRPEVTATPNGAVNQFEWDFGDGTVQMQTGSEMFHTYTSGGTYTVKLKIKDVKGVTNTTSKEITVAGVAIAPTIITTPLYERHTGDADEACYSRQIGTAKSTDIYSISNTTYCLRGGQWVDATGVDNGQYLDSQGNLYPFSSVEAKHTGNNTYTAGFGGSTMWNTTITRKSAGVYSQSVKSVVDIYKVYFNPNSYIYKNVGTLNLLIGQYNRGITNTGYMSSGGNIGFLFSGQSVTSGTVIYFNINDPNRNIVDTGTWSKKSFGSNTQIIELDEKSSLLYGGESIQQIYYKNSSESGVRDGYKSVAGRTNTMEVFDRTTFNAMLARDGLPATPN